MADLIEEPEKLVLNQQAQGNGDKKSPATVEDVLEAIQKQRDAYQNGFETKTSEIAEEKIKADELKADAASVDKSLQEIAKILSEYEKAYDDIRCDIEKHDKYEAEMASKFAKLPEKGQIDGFWATTSTDFENIDASIKTLNKKEEVKPFEGKSIQAAQNKHMNAVNDRDKKQVAYDEIKSKVAYWQTTLKELIGLQKSIDDNLLEQKRIAYVYFKDYQDKRNDVKADFNSYKTKENPCSETTPTYSQALFQAWKDLLAAQTTVRDEEKSVKEKTDLLAATQKELTDLKKSYMQSLIEKVKTIAS